MTFQILFIVGIFCHLLDHLSHYYLFLSSFTLVYERDDPRMTGNSNNPSLSTYCKTRHNSEAVEQSSVSGLTVYLKKEKNLVAAAWTGLLTFG